MPETNNSKMHTTFRCDTDLHFKLKAIAKADNRNLSNVIETLLKKAIEADILNQKQ